MSEQEAIRFAQEVDGVLANPEKLREYFSGFDPVTITRQQLHLAQALLNGNFILREGHYRPFLRERITDEDMETTKKALPELGKHLDNLIESFKINRITLGGYVVQNQTEEYQAKLHLIFGAIMSSKEITSDMLGILEEVTHRTDGEEFRTLFGLQILYSEEAGRRYYNREKT